jgi:hypothetical protein
MLVIVTAILLFAAATNAAHISSDTWTLVRVADSSARCLDGSPAAFYIRTGSKANAGKWIVHLEGGGWATDLGGHFERSQVQPTVCLFPHSLLSPPAPPDISAADGAREQRELQRRHQL